MRVLFFNYPSSFQDIGGGEIFLIKLKEYLEQRGIEVKLFDMWNDKIENFDILHIFCSVKDCLGVVKVAKMRGIKVVITPVFWSTWKRALFSYGSFRERMLLLLRHSTKFFFPSFPSDRRELLILSDVVSPNSEMEKDQVRRLFSIPESKIKVIFNGVDRRFTKGNPEYFRSKMGLDKFILSVGRIEPRKNQLRLIRASQTFKYPLVLIGDPVSGYEEYYETCRREATSTTRFIKGFSHEDPLLASAYAASELFVLPAWFETPGLAALEAAVAGTRLAVTRDGSTPEFFRHYVEYFNPMSPKDMDRAVSRALEKPKTSSLQQHILDHFTWEKNVTNAIHIYNQLTEHS